jgi:serine phosphatase RsbU (regulator of sigma subunit)
VWVVRAAWLAVLLLALVPAAAGFATLLGESSLEVLFQSGVFTIDPEISTGLQDLGLGHDFLLGADVGFRLLSIALFAATGIVIFLRKSDDWMTALVSATLLTSAAAWFAPLQALEEGSVARSVGEWVGNGLPFTSALGGSLAGLLIVVFMYLFPDGRFVPRWTVYAVGVLSIHFLLWNVFPGSVFDAGTWSNVMQIALVVIVAGSGLAAQNYRYLVLSGPIHKQQSKLVVSALVVVASVLVLLFALNPGLGAGMSDLSVVTPRVEALYNLILLAILGATLLTLPLSIGVSVLRYRLWDIDVFINRTLVYGAVTAILGSAYFGIVFGIGSFAGQSYVTVAAATLMVAAAFEPLRRKLQSLVDRYFFRRRYDASRMLEDFSARLREQIDLEELSGEMLTIVADTIMPAGVSVWVPEAADASLPPDSEMVRRIAFRAASQVNTLDFDESVLDEPCIDALRDARGPVDLRIQDFDSETLRAFRNVNVTLTVPLVSQGELVGMLNLGPRLSETDYSTEDLRFLAKLSDQAAAAVRLALLVREHESTMRERERMENEMHVAQLIQQQFLPKELPRMEGWDVHAYYHPAREVGGDFYDFIDLPDGRLCIVTGDVTGKGVPAALVMATTRSILRSEASRRLSPAEILRVANNQLVADIPTNMFVTCLCAIVDPHTGVIELANAGHNLPYVRHDQGVTELRATGMPLGLMPDVTYEPIKSVLRPGQFFVLHSDGLTEAHDTNRQMFGFTRLKSLIQACPEPKRIIDRLLGELGSFTAPGWEQEDDITLVVVHRTEAIPEIRMPGSDVAEPFRRAAAPTRVLRT